MNTRDCLRFALLGLVLSGPGVLPANAQWLTQSIDLVPGWNAVYLHVDASHATLDELVEQVGEQGTANPITEVWAWNPNTRSGLSVQRPPPPTGSETQWSSWSRAAGPASALQRLGGNSAYLVRVGGTSGFSWTVQGRPVPPAYQWNSSGLNFIGFPTPFSGPPSFERFLSQSTDLFPDVSIVRYVGGELGPGNPEPLVDLSATPLRRGEAVWVSSRGAFNQRYAPFGLELQNAAGVAFGDSLGQYRLGLRNHSTNTLTVRLELLPSEQPPVGQPSIAGTPPMLLRGTVDPTNLTYAYTSLASPAEWTLTPRDQPGSEVEVVLGLDRSRVAGPPGAFFAGTLRFTDDQRLAQVDLPVSASVPATTGLWVGRAAVTQVQSYLKSYQKDSAGALVQSPGGAYISTGTNTSLGGVARPFPLRLILHDDGASIRLLQRIHVGTRFGLPAVATLENLLDSTNKARARRISAAHLPWSAANLPWVMTGSFESEGGLTATVVLPHDDGASNPFVHSYHPDHDNLDSLFSTPLAQGEESYRVTRRITLSLLPPADDFATLTGLHRTRTGAYEESIVLAGKGTESREYLVRGVFSLSRISEIPILTTAP